MQDSLVHWIEEGNTYKWSRVHFVAEICFYSKGFTVFSCKLGAELWWSSQKRNVSEFLLVYTTRDILLVERTKLHLCECWQTLSIYITQNENMFYVFISLMKKVCTKHHMN